MGGKGVVGFLERAATYALTRLYLCARREQPFVWLLLFETELMCICEMATQERAIEQQVRYTFHITVKGYTSLRSMKNRHEAEQQLMRISHEAGQELFWCNTTPTVEELRANPKQNTKAKRQGVVTSPSPGRRLKQPPSLFPWERTEGLTGRRGSMRLVQWKDGSCRSVRGFHLRKGEGLVGGRLLAGSGQVARSVWRGVGLPMLCVNCYCCGTDSA